MKKDMPRAAEKAYCAWLNGYPDTYHWMDQDRFFAFVHLLHRYSRKPRSSDWLRDHLQADCPTLPTERIQAYCDEFDLIRRFLKASNEAQRQVHDERFAAAQTQSAQIFREYLASRQSND
jgi:hypothetical protein